MVRVVRVNTVPYFKQNNNIFNSNFSIIALTTLTTLTKHILSFCFNRYNFGQGDLNSTLTTLTSLTIHFDNLSTTGVEYIWPKTNQRKKNVIFVVKKQPFPKNITDGCATTVNSSLKGRCNCGQCQSNLHKGRAWTDGCLRPTNITCIGKTGWWVSLDTVGICEEEGVVVCLPPTP